MRYAAPQRQPQRLKVANGTQAPGNAMRSDEQIDPQMLQTYAQEDAAAIRIMYPLRSDLANWIDREPTDHEWRVYRNAFNKARQKQT
jgi:hypothetical protein